LDARRQVLAAMKAAGKPVTAGELASMTGLDRHVVDQTLADLKQDGSASHKPHPARPLLIPMLLLLSPILSFLVSLFLGPFAAVILFTALFVPSMVLCLIGYEWLVVAFMTRRDRQPDPSGHTLALLLLVLSALFAYFGFTSAVSDLVDAQSSGGTADWAGGLYIMGAMGLVGFFEVIGAIAFRWWRRRQRT
jgi:hypothetical protein